MTLNIQKYIEFKNGHKMPIVGFGTWQATDEEMEAALEVALEVGYRHIDTAEVYGNESAIGNVLQRWFKAGKLKREDVFIVTKLPPAGNRKESVEKHLKRSLDALQLDYVDLYLIHHSTGIVEGDELLPIGEDGNLLMDHSTDLITLWEGMEAQVDAGRAKSIGLSNFNARQIKKIVQSARIPPANLQVELHIYLQQKELVAFCKALDVTVCGFAPLGSPGYAEFFKNVLGRDISKYNILTPLTEPVVQRIAQKYKKTPAQILIRHIIQRDVAVIPKSSNPTRIKENFQVFDFVLSTDDVEELNALDKGSKGRLFGGVILPGSEKHPEYPYSDPY